MPAVSGRCLIQGAWRVPHAVSHRLRSFFESHKGATACSGEGEEDEEEEVEEDEIKTRRRSNENSCCVRTHEFLTAVVLLSDGHPGAKQRDSTYVKVHKAS